MVQVSISEARAQLSRLGERARKGERVVIAKNGKPYLDLVPHKVEEKRREPRRIGILKEQGWPEPEYEKFTEDELRDMFGEDIIGPPSEGERRS